MRDIAVPPHGKERNILTGVFNSHIARHFRAVIFPFALYKPCLIGAQIEKLFQRGLLVVGNIVVGIHCNNAKCFGEHPDEPLVGDLPRRSCRAKFNRNAVIALVCGELIGRPVVGFVFGGGVGYVRECPVSNTICRGDDEMVSFDC